MRERGIYTELANWRAVFSPANIPDAQKDVLRKIVIRATESSTWRQALLDNSWIGAMLYGKEFDDALEIEQGMAAAVTLMLKLQKS